MEYSNPHTIELIPVIEKWWHNDQLTSPDGSLSEVPAKWELYNQQAAVLAGYTTPWVPYSEGHHLYRFSDFTDNNLVKFIQEHIGETLDDGGEWDDIRVFNGGFVLRVGNEDRLFPGCCSDLLNIHDWEDLENCQEGYSFFNGHPEPYVSQNIESVTIDLSRTDEKSSYHGTASPKIILNKVLLREAIVQAKKKLQAFAERLSNLEQAHQLGIPDIGRLLVWNG
ncbi:hypothetical protein SAMN05421788_106113 [Filimonas lacunae]|uniref:Uncharacterized protein n=2 Tax=Filimonas lacunae TaxID=477680 RepID=A0A1N7QN83_9BACT|nr:hypothetical protein SAMN05421788_106113 [Filimonas lacunae]